MAVVTLTTDFGLDDGFVGIMKGVLATRAPGAVVIDVTHGIAPQDVLAGALVLARAAPYFPPGTIHVAVVDPRVGTARRPLCVVAAGALFVGPDNGLLSLATSVDAGARAIHVTDERLFLSPRSATFHGRDVFAPVAAALASGTDPGTLGPVVHDAVRLALPDVVVEPGRIRGQVLYIDRFGNLVTNVPETALAAFPRERVSTTIAGRCIDGLSVTYGAVDPGALVVVVGSWGLVEIAARDGSARAALGAAVGDAVVIGERSP
jgi:S-adenosylmethionine hydrolase